MLRFIPPGFPTYAIEKSADGTLIRLRTDEGITGYGWQNSFGSEIKIIGESRVFKDLVLVTSSFSQKNHPDSQRHHVQHEHRRIRGGREAMWDAIGKACRQPIHKVPGCAQDPVLVYASTGMLKTPEDTLEML